MNQQPANPDTPDEEYSLRGEIRDMFSSLYEGIELKVYPDQVRKKAKEGDAIKDRDYSSSRLTFGVDEARPYGSGQYA